jgi:hypothetical protein
MCAEFFAQFTAAEQGQLIRWVELLVAHGEVEIDETHPLSGPFDILTKYISREIDELPQKGNDRSQQRKLTALA